MKFVVEIDVENSAFFATDDGDDAMNYEISRILRGLAWRLEAGEDEGKLYDKNGNHVGVAKLIP